MVTFADGQILWGEFPIDGARLNLIVESKK